MFESKNPEIEKRSLTYRSYRLHHWEEANGLLERIWKENGLLKAIIGKIILIFPPELEETLETLQGQTISCLRTDIPEMEFMFRLITEDRPEHEKESAANAVQAIATETNAHQRKARRGS